MKLLLTFIAVALFILPGYSQPGIIKWDRNIKIKWSDFKAKADRKSTFAAMSAVGIHYKYNSRDNGKVYKITFEIYAIFDKSKSWSRAPLRTGSMLAHEQLHFDIGELVTRAFRREAQNRVDGRNYKMQILQLFNQYSRVLQKFQQKYDLQTMHGNNTNKQKEWENLIHQELRK